MKKTLEKYLPSLVYGASDGAVSYFALLAGAYGAGLSLKMILAVGISNIFADAFSMASADYLSEESARSENPSYSLRSAAATFFSFVSVGLIPLLPSVYSYKNGATTLSLSIFLLSTALTFISFMTVGYVRGTILKKNIYKTIAQSTVICSVSAIVAYGIGEYVAKLLSL